MIFFMVNVLWREIVARVVDIGGVVDHHYLYILMFLASLRGQNIHSLYGALC
jgi:hypothetical protein